MKTVLSYAASALIAASFASAAPQFSSQVETVRVARSCGFDCTRQSSVPLNGQFTNFASREPGSIGFSSRPPPGTICEVFDGNRVIGTVPTSFQSMTGVECIIVATVMLLRRHTEDNKEASKEANRPSVSRPASALTPLFSGRFQSTIDVNVSSSTIPEASASRVSNLPGEYDVLCLITGEKLGRCLRASGACQRLSVDSRCQAGAVS
jgi:hypothetical protein